MKEEVFISVIMPVHNGEKYIREAIDSILRQTYQFFEFIIVNDASTDHTDTIVSSYIDKRLVYLNNVRRLGNYKCRNRAAQVAKGKYLAMMDADDVAVPERLEKQFRYLEVHPAVLAVGSDRISIPMNLYDTIPHTHEEILLALLENNAFVHSSLMLRTSVFRKLGGYDERYYYSADYDLVGRLALTGKVVNLREALVFYRWHPGQISQQYKVEQAKYGAEIRRNYQQNFINCFKCESQAAVTIPDVTFSDIGRAIAYYTYAHYYENQKYEQMAERLFEEIVSSLSSEMPFQLEEGILGIACGVVYLLRNGFVEGDEDEVLDEIDGLLFWHLLYLTDENTVDWYGWFYYSRLRLSYKTLAERGLSGILFQQNFIYMLDCLIRSMQRGICPDKKTLSEVKWFHTQKICPVTTGKILGIHQLESPKIIASLMDIDRVSFLIPLRVDSDERVRNLDLLLTELIQIEGADIWILEADRYSRYQLKTTDPNVHYIFIEDANPVFHRTKYLNRLLKETDCDIAGIWDTDVMIRKEQIREAIDSLKMGCAAMSFPYDGRFYMISPEMSNSFVKEKSFETLEEHFGRHNLVHGFHSVGGAFWVNRKNYLQSGGENEHFYGWGPEDAERVKRMEILGLRVYRAKGALFHLYHPRKENSCYQNKEIELRNRQEFLNVCSMTQEELQKYIQTWEWYSNK